MTTSAPTSSRRWAGVDMFCWRPRAEDAYSSGVGRLVHRRHQSLRAGAPVASGSSPPWRTGIMPEAWQRPLPDAGIDGVESSWRPPQTDGMRSPCGPEREPARADVDLTSMRACRWHERCPRIKKGLRHVPPGSSPSGYISRTTGGRHELRAMVDLGQRQRAHRSSAPDIGHRGRRLLL
jgi:hypothetical protein